MKLLKFETIQPKGIFVIPETNFVSYRHSDESKNKRDSGTLVYKCGTKTSQVEVRAIKPTICFDTSIKE
jgi:hypothetical protein